MAPKKTENPSETLNEEKVVIKRDKTKQVQFNIVFIKKAITAASDNTLNKADKLDKDEITKLAEEHNIDRKEITLSFGADWDSEENYETYKETVPSVRDWSAA